MLGANSLGSREDAPFLQIKEGFVELIKEAQQFPGTVDLLIRLGGKVTHDLFQDVMKEIARASIIPKECQGISGFYVKIKIQCFK